MSSLFNLVKLLDILKSLIINYPVIREFNCGLTKLLLLVVEAGKSKAIIDLLSIEDAPRLNEMMGTKQLVRFLTNYESTYTVYEYFPSIKSKEFIATLSTVARIGEIGGHKLSSIPVVISEGVPYGCDMHDFFTVYINGEISGIMLENGLVVPADDQLMVVEDKIHTYITENHSQNKKALIAATCFLYPNMILSKEDALEEYLNQVEYLVEADDDNQDTNNLENIFISELYRWQERTSFHAVYALPNLEMSIISKLDQVILYDNDFIYMKEKVFKDVVKVLLRTFSIDTLKAELIDAGMLYAENSRTYTVKVGYYNLIGEYQRERMLRFQREKINIVGEMEFIEMCMYEREDNGCLL